MQTLHTERLILRTFQMSDDRDLYAYASSPNVGPAAGWKPHTSLAESQHILRMFMESDEVWAMCSRADGRVIGSIGLHADRRRSEEIEARMMGFVLSEHYWGQGLMPEAAREVLRYAFETLLLPIVSIVHFPFNTKSRRVIEKCGFRYEGTLRHASRIYSGDVYDDVCYSMTREEYIAGK